MNVSGSPNEGWDSEYACCDESTTDREPLSSKWRRVKKRNTLRRKDHAFTEVLVPNNESSKIGSGRKFCSERRVGGGDGRKQRLRCRQHELSSCSGEIDSACVIKSRDLSSKSYVLKNIGEESEGNDVDNQKPKSKRSNCPGTESRERGSTSTSTCSDGSYSRRKHHRHKHKTKCKSPSRAPDSSVIHPKVNPVFVWVRQEDTTIVEVLCEDYDYKNRLKLRRTHLGWRAIPKTKRFTDAVTSKAVQNESNINGSLSKPKKVKSKDRRKTKKSKKNKKVLRVMPSGSDVEGLRSSKTTKAVPEEFSVEIEEGKLGHLEPRACPTRAFANNRVASIIKSSSCDFSVFPRSSEYLKRSSSLNFVLKDVNETDSKDVELISKSSAEKVPKTKNAISDVNGCEEKVSANAFISSESGVVDDGPSLVMDMTKHDSDFNDADGDELGHLLNVIPDLEFVHEDELEEVDEEEWSSPTDLTLPKTPAEEKATDADFSDLPLNISPLVTMTSVVKCTEPLTAPRPEVTITPIPRPAHQQIPESSFLESLLSAGEDVKLERIDKSSEKRSSDFCARKTTKPFHDDSECVASAESKHHKKLKVEDITLKSLLSKNRTMRVSKGADLEKCVQNLKVLNGDDGSKSRIHEPFVDTNHSDPISQLKEVLSNPHLAVPDPLLVPRARLPALVASPASEIPRLLTMRLEKAADEKPSTPVIDSDVLEVSLSNLQSLLANKIEKSPWTNVRDIGDCQKTLDTLLEWQKYQKDLMEGHLKNSSSLPADYSEDVAAASALTQMLWLPYLNQFDFNTNRHIVSLMSSMFASDCHIQPSQLTAPPQINISQVSQPSPFLTPTSPMDIESHLKTLAMWQEAINLQQNPQLTSTGFFPDHYSSNRPQHSIQEHQEAFPVIHADDYSRRHRQMNEIEVRRREDLRNGESLMRRRRECHIQSKKPGRSNESAVHRPVSRGTISVKPLVNLTEKAVFTGNANRRWEDWPGGSQETTDLVARRLQQFNTELTRTKGKETPSVKPKRDDPGIMITPKLKVKNLVDPNTRPPQLLKHGGGHRPNGVSADANSQDDVQPHLWHPLFGSNQMRVEHYNSPWRWTTVTVNGE